MSRSPWFDSILVSLWPGAFLASNSWLLAQSRIRIEFDWEPDPSPLVGLLAPTLQRDKMIKIWMKHVSAASGTLSIHLSPVAASERSRGESMR